jgi:hypothetical protein
MATEDPGSVALTEILSRYDVLDVQATSVDPRSGSYLIVRERGTEPVEPRHSMPLAEGNPYGQTRPYITRSNRQQFAADASDLDLRELGYASVSPWTSWLRQEHLPELRDQQGIEMYQKMKRSDGTVRGTLRMLKTPITGARWFVEPASDSQRDINVAKFVWDNLDNDLNVTWSNLLSDILLHLDYGHMVFEKVFTDPYNPIESPDGRVRWKKLAPRHPLDIAEWMYDAAGGPNGIKMMSLKGDGLTPIFIDKLIVFTHDAEAGDLKGTSVLRSAYKHWYYKEQLYKIDAIQKERHGIGIPVIKLPPGANAGDKALAENLGRNLRTNERAHVTLPTGWELIFAKLEGQPVDAIRSIEHHDKEIAKNILAPFMETGGKDDEQSLFLKSTRYIANDICDIINRHAIPQLVDFNWRRVRYPKLRARRIGEWDDMRTMSFTLRNLVGAQLVTPDDVLEDSLRRELDLPLRDKATARELPALVIAEMQDDLQKEQLAQQEKLQNKQLQQQNKALEAQKSTNADLNTGNPRNGAADGAGLTSPSAPRTGGPRQTKSASVRTPSAGAGRDSSGG